MNIEWRCKSFENLSSFELYKILQLRSAVFVVEQNCIYQDVDGKDILCYHLAGWFENNVIACTRLVPPNTAYAEPSIGRVVTAPDFRKKGAGKILMKKSIELCRQLFGTKTIKIGAQLYLKYFYESFGFIKSSDVYLEDGIEHIEMLLQSP